MKGKDIKICNDLVCWEGPNFIGLSADFIKRENSQIFLIFSDKVKMVVLFAVVELLDFLTMGEFLELFFT